MYGHDVKNLVHPYIQSTTVLCDNINMSHISFHVTVKRGNPKEWVEKTVSVHFSAQLVSRENQEAIPF